MITVRISRRAMLMGAAATLLGTLVFLFVKTESSGYKADAQAVTLLRELRDLDARWDLDGQRLANDLSSTTPAVPDRGPVIARILQELEQGEARDSLGSRLGLLRAGLVEKQQAFAAFRKQHGQTVQATDAARQSVAAFIASAPAPKGAGRQGADMAGSVIVNAERIRTAIRTADIDSRAELESTLRSLLATVVTESKALDAGLAERANRLQAAVGAFVQARSAEGVAWRRFAFHTVGARIDLASRDLSRSIEHSLIDKDRWRAYLIAYSAALLLGLGYLFSRVIAADAALRASNQDLEARVAERTSDLTRTLKQLKESEAQLVQTEKMSLLGQLVAGVMHEINTPLAYVKSNLGSIADRAPQLRELTQDCEEALEVESLTRDSLHGVEQISELVLNLRNFSRLDRSKIASFNVNDGVISALLIARPMLRKIDVERRLGEVPAITCAPSQVNQVVLNLVTNAAQAIDKPRGRIVATTRREGSDAVAIVIEDDGKGIEPADLPKIFEPFFTTKDAGGGTGLGLSIVHKIVTQHGGRIDVASRPGQGTTFTVRLPIEPPPELAETSLAPAGATA